MFRRRRKNFGITKLPKDRKYMEFRVVLYDKAPSTDVGRIGTVLYEQLYEINSEVSDNA